MGNIIPSLTKNAEKSGAKTISISIGSAVAKALFFLMALSLQAKESNVASDSPYKTRTLHSKYLPPPVQPFGGVIDFSAFTSIPSWPGAIVPQKNAPNILLIMTDDVGFGAPSTFGGVIPTPALDKIASMGLRFTQFHSTALCSPTRAALLTGRNHHSAGNGVISELSTGFPGYNSIIGKDSATVGEILKQNGYGTAWFGKNHLTPVFQSSQVGPFDQWPNGLGFEYFYGFMGAETNQWQPNLFRNMTPIFPHLGKENWNLTTAMADEAIRWLDQLNDLAPQKPFFIFYAPGGTHAPHHPKKEWIERFKGQFDMGWNELRKKIFANQKKLGVIPESAKLTPWPADRLPEWSTLSFEEKKMFSRQAEVYAAYLAYTDHEIGRVIQAVTDLGKINNTLIIYISGDNGSSPEGTVLGTPNEVASMNGVMIPISVQLRDFYEAWGSDRTYPLMSAAWSWAFNTPFKWTKEIASHLGGIRQGMAIAWPNQIKDKGGIRHQFHHVIDIVPTILEVSGIEQPVMVNGAPQKPMEGVSMKYSFAKAHTKRPSHHRTQYFEMFGNRALYHDGWIANTTPAILPWDLSKETNVDANHFKWELYDLTKDWTQYDDLASARPEQLRKMQDMFLLEAAKYQVLPLDTSRRARLDAPKPDVAAGRTQFIYSGSISGIPYESAPRVADRSYAITAQVEIMTKDTEGMLVTEGGRFGGYGLYIKESRPVFLINFVNMHQIRFESAEKLSLGKHTISFDFTYNNAHESPTGVGLLKVDGQEVAKKKIDAQVPYARQWIETFDVGMDTGTPLDDKDYQVPFEFTGKLQRLVVQLK